LLESATAPHVRTFIALALFTGARTGAILELQWKAIDLPARRITFGAGHGNKRRAKPLPINDNLLAALVDARALATCPYVIEHAGQPVASVKKGFAAACRRAGIEGVTPHALRHTAASWLIQQGISFEQTAAMLGNTAAMVEQVYGHFAPDWLDQASAALGSIPGLSVPSGPGNVVSFSDRKPRRA
jgi:integrase